MAALGRYLRTVQGNRLFFWCPGCDHAHAIAHGDGPGPRWGWNGSADKPTFTPSVLVTWGEPNDDPQKFDDPAHDVPKVCHTFVTDGRIQYLGDCTHALAGQTVDMVDWPRPNWRDGDEAA